MARNFQSTATRGVERGGRKWAVRVLAELLVNGLLWAANRKLGLTRKSSLTEINRTKEGRKIIR